MSEVIQPVGEMVLVKELEQENKTNSGIYMPGTMNQRIVRAQVVAVGKGEKTKDGSKYMELEVGPLDVVVIPNYAGNEFTVNGVELRLVRESEILAKVG